MAKKKEQKKTTSGEQMALIDVAPENAKPIIAQARRYKLVQAERLQALAKETASKEKLLALIKEAKLQRLQDGSIRFKCDGFEISVTPRDELVKVKEPQEQD